MYESIDISFALALRLVPVDVDHQVCCGEWSLDHSPQVLLRLYAAGLASLKNTKKHV